MNSNQFRPLLGLFIISLLNAFIGVSIGTTANRQVMAVGGYCSAFIKADGSLWIMGDNQTGHFGLGGGSALTNQPTPMQIMPDIQEVSISLSHTVMITNDGMLWGIGNRYYGQLGRNDGVPTFTARALTPLYGEVAHVWAVPDATFILKENGSLWAIGLNLNGWFGTGDTETAYSAVLVSENVRTAAPAGSSQLGGSLMFVKTDGTLWSVGQNFIGQLGDGTLESRLSPVQVDTDVAIVQTGATTSVWIKNDGSIWFTGANIFPGTMVNGFTNTPVRIFESLTNVVEITITGGGVMLRTSDNELYALGAISVPEEQYVFRELTLLDTDVVDLVGNGSSNHALYIKSDGSLWAIGINSHGQLGDGTLEDRVEPVRVTDGMPTNYGNDFLDSNPDGNGNDVGDDHSLASKDDYDGDGDADLFMHDPETDISFCLRMNGGGATLGEPIILLDGSEDVELVRIMDANQDGIQDLLVRSTDGSNIHELRLQNEQGDTTTRLNFGNFAASVRLINVFDQNGDGVLDAIIYDQASKLIQIWHFDTNGQIVGLINVEHRFNGAQDIPIDVADSNADGVMDILFQSPDGEEWDIDFETLDANGRTLGNPVSQSINHVEGSICIGFGDYNNDGNLDIVWQNIETGAIKIRLLSEGFENPIGGWELFPGGIPFRLNTWQWELHSKE